MEITNNAAPLARLLDETAIRDTIARFADAATSGDSDGFRTLWADDAQWVIGSTEGQPFESRSKGIDEIVSHFRDLREIVFGHFHFQIRHLLHSLQYFQTATPSLPFEAIRRIGHQL